MTSFEPDRHFPFPSVINTPEKSLLRLQKAFGLPEIPDLFVTLQCGTPLQKPRAAKFRTGPAPKQNLRMKPKYLTLFSILLLLTSCGEKRSATKTVIDGFAQGGTYHIVLIGERDLSQLKPRFDSLFALVDRSMSLYNPGSLLNRINRNETDTLDTFIRQCLETARNISRESDGLYDVTVKPIVSAYGFTGGKATRDPNIDSLLRFVGYEKISVSDNRLLRSTPHIQIDLSSIAQGATADYIGRYIEELGIGDYLVEVGGEIFCRGTNASGRPWVVGIDRPFEGNFASGADLQVKLGISGLGLATSGNYRKYYTDSSGRKIVHTINPKTGMPVISNLLSATVVARTSALADAYGTLFMVMGLERSIEFLKTKPELQAYLIYSDEQGNYRTYITPQLKSMIVE